MAKRGVQRDLELLDEPDRIKVLSHRDRLAMAALLSREPMTGAMVAAALKMPANRVQYHLLQLLDQGIIREVRRGRKRWKEERFFQTVARHFLVDPELTCRDKTAATTIRQAIDEAMLEWRRREVLGIELRELAFQLVNRCLGARRGQRVMIMFNRQSMELAEALTVELEAVGAVPRLKIWSRNVLLHTLDRHDESALADLPFHDESEAAELDGLISINTSMPQGGRPTPEQLAKFRHRMEAVSRWQAMLRRRRVKYLSIGLAQRGEFEGGLTTPEVAIDTYWRCIATDYELLARRTGAMLERIGTSQRLRIGSDAGTDFTIDVDVARPHPNDGIISDDDVAADRPFDRLPAGSLMYLPIAGSGDGEIVGDYTFIGRRYRNVRAVVRRGRIEELHADQDVELLRDRIFGAAGDGRLAAVVRFGLNPAGRTLTGSESIDTCLEGAASVHFGNNEILGGTVKSTINLLLPINRASVEVNGTKLIDQGRLAEGIAIGG